MRELIIQAGFTVCLFLCLCVMTARGYSPANKPLNAEGDAQWQFTPSEARAYSMVFDLDFAGVHRLIPNPQSAGEVYVVSLAESTELLLEENGEKFTDYEEHFQARRERKQKSGSPAEIFLQAEMSVQWAFVYYKFGHEFDAALNLKDAYTIITQARKRYPQYEALKKTAALLEVIVGSVPEKYNWVLSLLGIEGSVDRGLALFDEVEQSSLPLKFEAACLHAMVRSYVLQQTAQAAAKLDKMQKEKRSPLVSFLAASVAIKNADNEKAHDLLVALDSLRTYRIDYASYLLGEVYLCKAEYLNSISAYRKFLNHYKGENNIKDAYFKIGLCYWLHGNVNDATETFKTARNQGREVTEADKYAARSLAEDELPHLQLTQARYYIDGGYYDDARRTLRNIKSTDLKTQRDELEFYYRKARLDHKTSMLEPAVENYKKVIALNRNGTWYYAPNACLQIGYIRMDQKRSDEAKEYFEMALSYKKHEYKNSIDTKARSALAQLKRK